jgi:hypothetical protein
MERAVGGRCDSHVAVLLPPHSLQALQITCVHVSQKKVKNPCQHLHPHTDDAAPAARPS